MKLSRPKEYIRMLLAEITQLNRDAIENYMHESYQNSCPMTDSHDKLNRALAEIEIIKLEILELCSELRGQ